MRAVLQIPRHMSGCVEVVYQYVSPMVIKLMENRKINEAVTTKALMVISVIGTTIAGFFGYNSITSVNQVSIELRDKISFFSKIDINNEAKVIARIEEHEKELKAKEASYEALVESYIELKKKIETIMSSTADSEVGRILREKGLGNLSKFNKKNPYEISFLILSWIEEVRHCNKDLVNSNFRVLELKQIGEGYQRDLSNCNERNEKAIEENKKTVKKKDRKIEKIREKKDEEGKEIIKSHKSELEKLRSSKDETISSLQKENTGCLIEKHACVVELEKRKQNWIFC